MPRRCVRRVPGVEVNTQLMPFDKANELATIALSSGANTFDIVYASDSTVLKYAKNGWLRPIDDLFEKYKEEFRLDEYPEIRDRHLSVTTASCYVVPGTTNVMLLFYRTDLFEEAGKQPPETFEQYVELAADVQHPAPRRHDQLPEAGRCRAQRDALVHQRPRRWLVRRRMKPIFNQEAASARSRCSTRSPTTPSGASPRRPMTSAPSPCSRTWR